VSLSLKELQDWVPELGDLAIATRDRAINHSTSTQFYQDLVKASTWQGQAADEARMSMLMAAAAHDVKAEDLSAAADAMNRAEQDAQKLADTVKAILDDAAAAPAVEIDPATNQVKVPASYDYLDDEAKMAVSQKIADLEARIADAVAEGDRIDADLAKAIAKATGLPAPTTPATTLPELLGIPGDGPLAPGQVRNNGPVAGTGSDPGIPGIKAADLGEIVTLPNGKQVAIFGDSYGKPQVGGEGNPHYPSVAVPVTFDKNGSPHFGAPLTGTNLNSGTRDEVPGPNTLFPLPQAALDAGANNALPAGSITTRDGKTYMMVVGTNTNHGLEPVGGSWMVEVTNEPAGGWKPVEGSYHGANNPSNLPTQVSGYQGSDGKIYVAGDSFDRSQGVSMYQVDPADITSRQNWQPWNGQEFGQPGQSEAVPISQRQNFGELSFREVEGRPVLSGFNAFTGNTEIRVGDGPPVGIFDGRSTIVAQGGQWGEPGRVPQNYGGYIMPGATLSNMSVLVSQWNTDIGAPYTVKHFQVHPNH
jgi:hypothetical protein